MNTQKPDMPLDGARKPQDASALVRWRRIASYVLKAVYAAHRRLIDHAWRRDVSRELSAARAYRETDARGKAALRRHARLRGLGGALFALAMALAFRWLTGGP
jgi:ferric-dicitrate binding protein FerR (iron transport regulator)